MTGRLAFTRIAALFVGGPWDGRKCTIPDTWRFSVAPGPGFGTAGVLYVRRATLDGVHVYMPERP